MPTGASGSGGTTGASSGASYTPSTVSYSGLPVGYVGGTYNPTTGETTGGHPAEAVMEADRIASGMNVGGSNYDQVAIMNAIPTSYVNNTPYPVSGQYTTSTPTYNTNVPTVSQLQNQIIPEGYNSINGVLVLNSAALGGGSGNVVNVSNSSGNAGTTTILSRLPTGTPTDILFSGTNPAGTTWDRNTGTFVPTQSSTDILFSGTNPSTTTWDRNTGTFVPIINPSTTTWDRNTGTFVPITYESPQISDIVVPWDNTNPSTTTWDRNTGTFVPVAGFTSDAGVFVPLINQKTGAPVTQRLYDKWTDPNSVMLTPDWGNQIIGPDRVDWYNPADLGDRFTQNLIARGMSPEQALNAQYEAAKLTPDTRDDLYYKNELTHALQNNIVLASDFHYDGLSSGIPTGPNPYENVADLSVYALKGTTGKDAGFSTTDSSILGLTGGIGIQDVGWGNDVYNPATSPNFTTAIDAITKAENTGAMGVYGQIPLPTTTLAGGETRSLGLGDQILIATNARDSYFAGGPGIALPWSFDNPMTDPANATGIEYGYGVNKDYYATGAFTDKPLVLPTVQVAGSFPDVAPSTGTTWDRNTGTFVTAPTTTILPGLNVLGPLGDVMKQTEASQYSNPILTPTDMLSTGTNPAGTTWDRNTGTFVTATTQPIGTTWDRNTGTFIPINSQVFTDSVTGSPLIFTPLSGAEQQAIFAPGPNQSIFDKGTGIIDTGLDTAGGFIRSVGGILPGVNVVDMANDFKVPGTDFNPLYITPLGPTLMLADRPGAQSQAATGIDSFIKGDTIAPYGEYSNWGAGASNLLGQQFGNNAVLTGYIENDTNIFNDPNSSLIDKGGALSRIVGNSGMRMVVDNPEDLVTLGAQSYLLSATRVIPIAEGGISSALGVVPKAIGVGENPFVQTAIKGISNYAIPAAFTTVLAGEATRGETTYDKSISYDAASGITTTTTTAKPGEWFGVKTAPQFAENVGALGAQVTAFTLGSAPLMFGYGTPKTGEFSTSGGTDTGGSGGGGGKTVTALDMMRDVNSKYYDPVTVDILARRGVTKTGGSATYLTDAQIKGTNLDVKYGQTVTPYTDAANIGKTFAPADVAANMKNIMNMDTSIKPSYSTSNGLFDIKSMMDTTSGAKAGSTLQKPISSFDNIFKGDVVSTTKPLSVVDYNIRNMMDTTSGVKSGSNVITLPSNTAFDIKSMMDTTSVSKTGSSLISTTKPLSVVDYNIRNMMDTTSGAKAGSTLQKPISSFDNIFTGEVISTTKPLSVVDYNIRNMMDTTSGAKAGSTLQKPISSFDNIFTGEVISTAKTQPRIDNYNAGIDVAANNADLAIRRAAGLDPAYNYAQAHKTPNIMDSIAANNADLAIRRAAGLDPAYNYAQAHKTTGIDVAANNEALAIRRAAGLDIAYNKYQATKPTSIIDTVASNNADLAIRRATGLDPAYNYAQAHKTTGVDIAANNADLAIRRAAGLDIAYNKYQAGKTGGDITSNNTRPSVSRSSGSSDLMRNIFRQGETYIKPTTKTPPKSVSTYRPSPTTTQSSGGSSQILLQRYSDSINMNMIRPKVSTSKLKSPGGQTMSKQTFVEPIKVIDLTNVNKNPLSFDIGKTDIFSIPRETRFGVSERPMGGSTTQKQTVGSISTQRQTTRSAASQRQNGGSKLSERQILQVVLDKPIRGGATTQWQTERSIINEQQKVGSATTQSPFEITRNRDQMGLGYEKALIGVTIPKQIYDITTRQTPDITTRQTPDITTRQTTDITTRQITDIIPRQITDITPGQTNDIVTRGKTPFDITNRPPIEDKIVSPIDKIIPPVIPVVPIPPIFGGLEGASGSSGFYKKGRAYNIVEIFKYGFGIGSGVDIFANTKSKKKRG